MDSQRNYLAFAVMYFAVCLLIGYLPFLLTSTGSAEFGAT